MKPSPNPGYGMPTGLYLEMFGWYIYCAFGEWPYLVGSALMGKTWRDVDVRVILSDIEYSRLGFGDPKYAQSNYKWVALVMAFSELGKKLTGLPIDFQIQQQTDASRCDGDKPRSSLGIKMTKALQ